MPAVLTALTDSTDPDWVKVGKLLSNRADYRGLRTVLGAGTGEPISTDPGLVYVDFSPLFNDLPEPGSDPGTWGATERSAMTALHMVFHFALEQSRQRVELKKLVNLTELHMITAYPIGRRLVAQLARTGSALQTYLLLDTQGAGDLSQVSQVIEQRIMTICHYADSDPERTAQAALLGRPGADPVITDALAGLGKGQAVFRDRHGRIGLVEIDRMNSWLAETLDTRAERATERAHRAAAATGHPDGNGHVTLSKNGHHPPAAEQGNNGHNGRNGHDHGGGHRPDGETGAAPAEQDDDRRDAAEHGDPGVSPAAALWGWPAPLDGDPDDTHARDGHSSPPTAGSLPSDQPPNGTGGPP